MTDVARTPDDRFADLPGYGYEPVYTQVTADDGTELRLARVDEGPAHGHSVVLLHGEPTWGFLWREVMTPLLDHGHRVIVPDHVGFGRSDKPQPRDWYSYERLYDTMSQHLDAALKDETVTLVVHDWGGPLGLRWAAEHPECVDRLVILDTGLYRSGSQMGDDWWKFRDFVEQADEFPIGTMIDGVTLTELPDEVLAAYEAPFPDASYHGGPLALPLLVPTSDDAPGAREQMAAMSELETWDTIPVLPLWGAKDPVIPPKVGERLSELIPSARPCETVEGSHFLQEDAGEEIGQRICDFIDETS